MFLDIQRNLELGTSETGLWGGWGGVAASEFLFVLHFFKPKFNHCLPLSVNHYYLTNSCCRDLIDLFSSIDLDVYYLALKVRGLSARTPCQGWGWGYTSVDQQVEILQMRKYHRYKYHKHWNILDTEILIILKCYTHRNVEITTTFSQAWAQAEFQQGCSCQRGRRHCAWPGRRWLKVSIVFVIVVGDVVVVVIVVVVVVVIVVVFVVIVVDVVVVVAVVVVVVVVDAVVVVAHDIVDGVIVVVGEISKKGWIPFLIS